MVWVMLSDRALGAGSENQLHGRVLADWVGQWVGVDGVRSELVGVG